jgi:hypothetical protein
MMSPAVSLHLVCGFPSLPCLISGSSHFSGPFLSAVFASKLQGVNTSETAVSQVQDLPNEPTRNLAPDLKMGFGPTLKIGACVQIGLPTMCMET